MTQDFVTTAIPDPRLSLGISLTLTALESWNDPDLDTLNRLVDRNVDTFSKIVEWDQDFLSDIYGGGLVVEHTQWTYGGVSDWDGDSKYWFAPFITGSSRDVIALLKEEYEREHNTTLTDADLLDKEFLEWCNDPAKLEYTESSVNPETGAIQHSVGQDASRSISNYQFALDVVNGNSDGRRFAQNTEG